MTTERSRGQSGNLAHTSLMLVLLFLQPTASALAEIIPADRRIQWDPGVRGGIPNRTTIFANVKNAPYNAVGNGVMDDTAAIQAAITACPSNQVVYLPAGTYIISKPIAIKNGVTVRGAGQANTSVKGASSYAYLWLMGFEDPTYDYGFTRYASMNLASSGLTKGSTTIATSAAHGWNPGDFIQIDELESPNGDPPISNDGSSGPCTWCGRASGNRPIGQWVQVMSVPSSTTATIYPSLDWNYRTDLTAQGVKASGLTQGAGLEDLAVDNSLSDARDTIYFHFAVNCWCYRVEMKGSHRRMVDVWGGFWCTIKQCEIHDGVPALPATGAQYGGNRAYGVFLGGGCSAFLVENNNFSALELPVSLEGAPSGHVIAYNYFTDLRYNDDTWQRASIGCHGAHPMMNLIEGNWSEGKFQADYYWGTSSHQTFFRNRMYNAPGKTYGDWGNDLNEKVRYYNFVGNVFGKDVENVYDIENMNFNYEGDHSIYRLGYTTAGDYLAEGNDPNVKSTLLRHGNFDSVHNSTVWDPTITDKNLPASLYLTNKPGWWGNLPWPAIGPDLSPIASLIPAQVRFNGGGSSQPLAPTNLRVVSSP
jgi:Pectate lyase superfamily protein